MQKSAVMTLANALQYKKHYNRSTALKRAWAMIKQSVFHSKAVGVTFGLRQKALAKLKDDWQQNIPPPRIVPGGITPAYPVCIP